VRNLERLIDFAGRKGGESLSRMKQVFSEKVERAIRKLVKRGRGS